MIDFVCDFYLFIHLFVEQLRMSHVLLSTVFGSETADTRSVGMLMTATEDLYSY